MVKLSGQGRRISVAWVGIAAIFVFMLLWASAGIVQANPETTPLNVYNDQLLAGWSNGSTGASINLNNSNPIEGGTRSIAVSPSQAGATFLVERSNAISIADYDTLRFWLHGGNNGGQQLRVMLKNAAGTLVNSSVIVTAPAGNGVQLYIPLEDLGNLTQVRGIALRSIGSAVQATYYIDNLKFMSLAGGSDPTATPPAGSPTPPAIPPGGYLQTFDGDPSSPQAYRPADWDVTVHSRNNDTWYNLEPMNALHGSDCAGPPATHGNTSYEGSVFQCRNHMMTGLRASGYGVVYLTPNQMVDFSGGEAVIRFDASTLRTSGRDWIDLWVTPYDDNLQAPLEDWLPDLNGEPRRAIHIRMDFGTDGNLSGRFDGEVINNFIAQELPTINSEGYESFLVPSASQRSTFELRISNNHIKFGMPAYNFYWIDTNVSALGWNQGIVQFGQHSYNPMKNCSTCTPNTIHWDNISISPAVPFTILGSNRRYVQPGANTVNLSAPAPANARLRFSGIGENLEVSFNGGNTWQPAQKQAQEQYHEDHFRSYWTPIPAGTTSIKFRGQEWWGGDWHARDITVWSRQAPAGAPESIEGGSNLALLSWDNVALTAPEVCDLPSDQQVAILATDR